MRGRKIVMKTRLRLITLAAFSCGLAACATIPTGKTAEDWLAVLPPDADYYFYLNTGRSKDLAKAVLKKTPLASPEIDQLLAFTDRLYCGVKNEPGKKPALTIVLLGGYPYALKSVLDGSKELEAIKGDVPAWRYKKLGYEIALPRDYMIVVSQTSAAGLVEAARSGGRFALSAPAVREMEANDLVLLLPSGLSGIAGGLPLPERTFEEVWLGARRGGDRYNFSGAFTVGPDVDAERMKKVLQFAMLALLRLNGTDGAVQRLKAMTYTVEDRMIKVSDLFMTRAEVESLAVNLLSKGL